MPLNERQLALYNYLLNKDGWEKRADILNNLKELYGYEPNGNLYKNTAASTLTRDVKELNNSPEIRKLIIFNSQLGIKIATKEEARDFLIKNGANNIRRMQKHMFLQDKLNKDGQIALVGDGIKVLDTFRR